MPYTNDTRYQNHLRIIFPSILCKVFIIKLGSPLSDISVLTDYFELFQQFAHSNVLERAVQPSEYDRCPSSRRLRPIPPEEPEKVIFMIQIECLQVTIRSE